MAGGQPPEFLAETWNGGALAYPLIHMPQVQLGRMDYEDGADRPTGAHAAVLTAQAEAEQLRAKTAALRREAAEILSRSRVWRDQCRRELLRSRRWHGGSSLSDAP
jgi:hypothetical protein